MSTPPYHCFVEALPGPALVLHGGAGSYLRTTTAAQRQARGARMLSFAQEALRATLSQSARQGVLQAVGAMEQDLDFNAGLGGKLQRDGQVRVSAALMDGRKTRMSAVFNVPGCLHPSLLADALQERGDRNLDGLGAKLLMQELGVPWADLRTAHNLRRWQALLDSGDTTDPESAMGDAGHLALDLARQAQLPVPEDLQSLRTLTDALPDPEDRYGTVGAVGLDASGALWACTSTGGRGHESPGRVSDSAMPAGNYACPAIALSATGFGEQIIDLNLCGRIATRVLDGASLEEALRRTFDEVAAHGGLLGVIALTASGEAGYAHSTEACGVAWANAAGQHHIDAHGR